MRTLVIGCGSIGQRHIRNLQLLGEQEILAYDLVPGVMHEAVRRYSLTPCGSVEEGLDRKPAMVLICTPPSTHISLARQSVAAGCHVFVEKPLGDRLDGADDLLAEAKRHQAVLCVGYNLRFHAGLLRLKQRLDQGAIGRVMSIRAEFGQYLPDWRPGRDYRHTYTARATTGGGIILDASHELEYVRWLGGEVNSVYCRAGRLSDLDIDVEDVAEITLHMKESVIAQVHVDCVQRGYARNCKVIGEAGTLIWDYKTGVRHYDAAAEQWHDETIVPESNEMYVEELKHFLMCARGEATPVVNGETGKRVLEIAMAAKQSASERCEVRV